MSGSQRPRFFVAALACAILLAGGLGRAKPKPEAKLPPGFTGARACGSCHPAAYKIWRHSAHATAIMSLGEQRKAAGCLACHATGDGISRRLKMDGVQCEACHGAGKAYSPEDIMRNPRLARALGMRDVSTDLTAVCAPCHAAGTKVLPFSAKRAWQQIAH